jgi:hypothetical protein
VKRYIVVEDDPINCKSVEEAALADLYILLEHVGLSGWNLVRSGQVQAGDRYWSSDRLIWLPITVNDFRDVSEFDAVIRKG